MFVKIFLNFSLNDGKQSNFSSNSTTAEMCMHLLTGQDREEKKKINTDKNLMKKSWTRLHNCKNNWKAFHLTHNCFQTYLPYLSHPFFLSPTSSSILLL